MIRLIALVAAALMLIASTVQANPCDSMIVNVDRMMAKQVPAHNPGYHWDYTAGRWWTLWHGYTKVGSYDSTTGLYYAIDSRGWKGPGGQPPWDVDTALIPGARLKRANYGIIESKLSKAGERWTIDGQVVRKDEALDALRGAAVPDDLSKTRLTVIGPEPERKQVLSDLDSSPDLAPLKEKVLTQAVPPEHWSVARSGFKTDGKPEIYLQNAAGKVLHRQSEYVGGAPALATAIRKANPLYDAAKDPDLRKPDASPIPLPKGMENMGWIIFIAIGGIVGYIVATLYGGKPRSPTPTDAPKVPTKILVEGPAATIGVSSLSSLIIEHVESEKAARAAREAHAKAIKEFLTPAP